jgi:hypothetical protein
MATIAVNEEYGYRKFTIEVPDEDISMWEKYIPHGGEQVDESGLLKPTHIAHFNYPSGDNHISESSIRGYLAPFKKCLETITTNNPLRWEVEWGVKIMSSDKAWEEYQKDIRSMLMAGKLEESLTESTYKTYVINQLREAWEDEETREELHADLLRTGLPIERKPFEKIEGGYIDLLKLKGALNVDVDEQIEEFIAREKVKK